jgi:hypothetical protein
MVALFGGSTFVIVPSDHVIVTHVTVTTLETASVTVGS